MNTALLGSTLAIGALGVFVIAYAVCRWLDNYGFVDAVWCFGFTAVGIALATKGAGWGVRRGVLGALVALWSLRLGTHLLVRLIRHHPKEDARYVQLRRDWAGRFAPMMFGFFQLQAVSIVFLSVGFVVSAQDPFPQVRALELAGIALWLVGVGGEALADAQLAAFKRRHHSHPAVCDVGLWRYSRHPNYFFEWVIWLGFAVFALPAPWGFLGLVGPAAMLYLLLRVTGVPLAEAQSLRSKGAAYRAYQARTNAFFPGPPKNSSAPSLRS